MTPEPTPLVTVLPCDRMAVARFYGYADGRLRVMAIPEHARLAEAFARHRLAALEEASPAMHLASNWLRACSDWLLSNDLDMKMPAGVLDADPLDIADALDAILALSNKGGRDGE